MGQNKDLIQEMKLKSTRQHYVFNGNIECRFLKYEMYAGTRRADSQNQSATAAKH